MPALPPTFVIADLIARGALHETAYSALPDAPVQRYRPPVDRGATLRAVVDLARRAARRPARICAETPRTASA